MSGPLVLLVDDFADARDLYGTFLRAHGYRVEEAEDGLEGIAKAVALHPSVIVMDVSMPNLDGWAATRRLKADSRTMRIPIICLTAHGRPDEQARALQAGCDSFMTKPRLPRDVAAEIDRVLGGAGGGYEARP